MPHLHQGHSQCCKQCRVFMDHHQEDNWKAQNGHFRQPPSENCLKKPLQMFQNATISDLSLHNHQSREQALEWLKQITILRKNIKPGGVKGFITLEKLMTSITIQKAKCCNAMLYCQVTTYPKPQQSSRNSLEPQQCEQGTQMITKSQTKQKSLHRTSLASQNQYLKAFVREMMGRMKKGKQDENNAQQLVQTLKKRYET